MFDVFFGDNFLADLSASFHSDTTDGLYRLFQSMIVLIFTLKRAAVCETVPVFYIVAAPESAASVQQQSLLPDAPDSNASVFSI